MRFILLVISAIICVTSEITVDDVIERRCCSSGRCFPTQEDLAYLHGNLTGRLILPNMDEYRSRVKMTNTFFVRFPSVIVMVKSTRDIQISVLFARKFNLHVTIQSSGNDFIGRSTWEGSFMINLSELNDIDIRLSTDRNIAGEVTVGTGNTWQEIYKKLDGTGRVVVGGAYRSVTPGGFTQGGGHGPLSRSLGLAVDNVLEMKVVLAHGRLAICTETHTIVEDVGGLQVISEDGDLFWALRGGGGGTFGIVSTYTFKLHFEPSSMVRIVASFPLRVETTDSNPGFEILNRFHAMVKTLPREYSMYVHISNNKYKLHQNLTGLSYDIHITGDILFSILKFGPWTPDTMDVLRELEFINPALRFNWTAKNLTSFWDMQKDTPGIGYYRVYTVNSFLMKNSFTENLTDFLMRTMITENTDGLPYDCTHTVLGGRVSDVGYNVTAVHPSFRVALSSFTCGIGMLGANPSDAWSVAQGDARVLGIGKEFGKKLRAFGFGEYINEPDPLNENWKDDYWYCNYGRLLRTKMKYDPDNFFTCHHCVGSDIDLTTSSRASIRLPYIGVVSVSLFVLFVLFIC